MIITNCHMYTGSFLCAACLLEDPVKYLEEELYG
jgi:hypothetical protein